MKATGPGRRAIAARSWVRTLAGAGAIAMIGSIAAAAWPGGGAALALTQYPTPAIAVAGGNTVIAVQTSEDGLRFYWNQYGTNNWYGEQVAANGTTFSPPTMVQDGNAVIIAAVGPKDSLDFYWQQNGASGWNAETVAAAWSIFSAPSMAVDGDIVDIATEGPNNSLTFYWAWNGTSTWGPETVAGAGTTYSAPSLAVNGGGVNIAAEGPEQPRLLLGAQRHLHVGPGDHRGPRDDLLRPGHHREPELRQRGRRRTGQLPGLLLAAERNHAVVPRGRAGHIRNG